MKNAILLTISVLCWLLMPFYFFNNGNTVVAALTLLPTIAIILAFLTPGSGIGHFALTHKIGAVKTEEISKRKYALLQAKWWALGSSTLPIAHGVNVILNSENSIYFLISFVGYIFGIACFIKLLTSLFVAARACDVHT